MIQEGASNSSLTNWGSSAPMLASVWAMKLAAYCCTSCVQLGLHRAVALVMDRGAIRRPLGLPTDGLHDGLPKW